MLMRRLRREDGFSITEVLASMIIGMVVLFAAFGMLDGAAGHVAKTRDRVDAVQRGRIALDRVVSQLRSTVCVPNGANATLPAIVAGSDADSVTFYAVLGDENATPEMHRLRYANGTILEDIWTARTPLTSPPTWNAPATRTLVSPVTRVGTTPVFSYWGFDGNLPANVSSRLAAPLLQADAGRVVQVDVSFLARPTGATQPSKRDAAFQGSAYLRTADPIDPAQGAKCS
jgi:type II secretory pathway component PulJ